MKKFRNLAKGISAIVLAATFFFSQVPVYADYSAKAPADEAEAGKTLGDVLEAIRYFFYYDISVEELYHAAVRGMAYELDDYSEYFNGGSEKAFFDSLAEKNMGMGFQIGFSKDFEFVIDSIVPGSPAQKAGLLPGDIILTVEGMKFDIYSDKVDEIGDLLTYKDTYEKSLTREIKVKRVDKELTFKVGFAEIAQVYAEVIQNEKLVRTTMIEKTSDNVGVIKLRVVGEGSAKQMQTAINDLIKKGAKNLVLDLRDNPGGYVDEAVEICQMLVKRGLIATSVTYLGEKTTYNSVLDKLPFEKVVVMVNDQTASAAEMIAYAIQKSGSGTVYGVPTFGKAVSQSMYSFPYGGVMKITTGATYGPDNKTWNYDGVKPDTKSTYASISEEVKSYDFSAGNAFTAAELSKLMPLLVLNGITPIEKADAKGVYSEKAIKDAISQYQKTLEVEATGELDEDTYYAIYGSLYKLYASDIDLSTVYNSLATK